MYYEEKVVNGVLCFRGTPNGDWLPMSVTELTGRVVFAEKKLYTFDQAREALKLARRRLNEGMHGKIDAVMEHDGDPGIVKLLDEALAAMEATHE